MRRRLLFVTVVGLLGVALLAPTASAERVDFRAPLSHAQEVTLATPAPGAHGYAKFTLEGSTLHYEITVRHLTGSPVMAHIHAPADRHASAPPAIWLCGTAIAPGPGGTPTCNATTDGLVIEGSASVTSEQLAWIESGLAYVNVHTQANFGGEVRGQILSVGG